MILKFELSKTNLELLALSPEDEICYAAPYDVAEDGSLLKDSYVVATRTQLILLEQGKVKSRFPYTECDKITSEPQINCGLLILTSKGEDYILARFSSRHLSRFSYIARGCSMLISGNPHLVVSEEYEKTCPNCGRALPGTRECPHCSKQGTGFVRDFLKMLSPYKKQLLLIIFIMLLAAVVTLLNPEIQKHLIDDVLTDKKGSLRQAFFFLSIIFCLSMGMIFINISKNYLCAKLGSTLSLDLRAKLYHKIQLLSLSFINDRRPGELMNRIVHDTARVKQFMEDVFCNLFTICIIFICDIIYMLILDVKLALLAFIFLPITLLLSTAFRKNIHRLFHRQWQKSDDVNSSLQDVISGMSVVKSYGKEESESEKFNVLSDSFAAIQRRNEIFWAVFYPLLSFVMGAGIYLITYLGGVQVLNGSKTTGELIQFINYTSMLYMYLGWLTNLPRQLMNLVNSVERINDVMSQEPRIVNSKNAKDVEIKGAVEFQHATFGYKSYKPILEDVSLTINPGEMIGLVGASGTGKSTLINLIMHLYELDDGKLLIDGTDIRDIRLENYHSQIGVVLQETFLFSGTIVNNIRFAKPDATYEEVIRAAKMANAHDFICRTPDGYNTYVGERGFNLSGGERQRIAIARAILNQPKLLILDEATASLDTESEYLIQKALERLTDGRTTFAIAHRLSTLKDADRLVVIDGHRIAEIGTHNELMEKQGIYYGLVTAQLEMQKVQKDN